MPANPAQAATELERKQRIRFARFRLALITYLLWIGFSIYFDAAGLLRGHVGPLPFSHWYLIAGIVASNALFWWLIATGRNLRYRDPSLAMPQMLAACTWALLFGGLLADRGIAVLLFVVIFLFGIFNLSWRQYALVWSYCVAGFGLLILGDLDNLDADARRMEVLYLVLLALVLFWVAFFGHYIGRLRQKLSLRNTELRQALEMVEQLAVRDDLTGAHNRRFVMEALQRELKRAERGDYSFALLLIDIDHFKNINDTHGHMTGDAVLKGIVRRLREQVRSMDLVGKRGGEFGRYGGEEFMVLLPDTVLAGAKRTAERIRHAIDREPFVSGGERVHATVSIGAAEYRRGETLRELLERADAALYAAKDEGRNRVSG